MRVATADNGKRSWGSSSPLTGNAAPAARFIGQNVIAQRAAEVAERRAVFDANNSN